VEDSIFQGSIGENEEQYMDSIRIFFDTDNDEDTGYQIQSLGADYMIETHGFGGLLKKRSINRYTLDQENHDWAGWEVYSGGEIEHNHDSLEVSIYSFDPAEKFEEDQIRAYFHVTNNREVVDTSDYIIDTQEQGAIKIIQRPLVNDIIDPLENNEKIDLIELELTAKGKDIKIDTEMISEKLSKLNYDLELTGIPELLLKDQTFKASIKLGSSNQPMISPGNTINIDLNSVLASKFNNQDDIGIPITVTGEPLCVYYSSAPEEIIIDGAFADWNDIKSNLDMPSEISLKENPNIDILDFRDAKNDNTLSFYLQVDGSMMDGASVIAKPLLLPKEDPETKTDTDKDPSSVNNKKGPDVNGLDLAYVFISTDPANGYPVTEFARNNINFKANYKIELTGRQGNIISKVFHVFDPVDYTWQPVPEVIIDAETDAHRLEAQLDLISLSSILNIPLKEFNYAKIYYQMTDWSDGSDISIKLPVFNSDINLDNIEKYDGDAKPYSLTKPSNTNSQGSRGAPGDWSLVGWTQLTPGESFVDGNQTGEYEIYEIFANDSAYDLYLKIQLELLNPPNANLTYDFYFNVSSTVWYRMRLYRANFSVWDFNVSYNTSATVPDDNSNWTIEFSDTGIITDTYNNLSFGFYFDNSDSVHFWANKTNLSQGYSSLYASQNCTMFADVHDYNRSQAGISDRAPDSGVAWYNSTGTNPALIPEYDWLVMPLPFMIMFMLILISTRKSRYRRKPGLAKGDNDSSTGGDEE
jgi:hypothetical protein